MVAGQGRGKDQVGKPKEKKGSDGDVMMNGPVDPEPLVFLGLVNLGSGFRKTTTPGGS